MRERLNPARLGATTPLMVGVGVATVASLVLGLIDLGAKTLWTDEGVSHFQASGSWGDLGSTFTDSEPNIVFYYALLKCWTAVAGTGEAALRLPSVLLTAATIPVVAAIGARIYGPRAALIAAGLLALSPHLLRYAQEARQYALALLLVSVSTLLFLRAVEPEHQSWRRWAAWAVVSAAAVWAHLFAGFVLAAQALSLLFNPRRPPLPMLLGAGAVLAALVAPLAIAMASLGLDQLEWIPPTTWPIVRDGFEELAGGPVLRWVLLGGAAVGLLAAAVDRRRGASDDRPASEGPDQRRPEPWQLVLVTGWLVLPFVLAIAYSELFQPAFLTRYLIVALPGLMLLAAAGLTRLRPWPLLAVALVATAVIASDRLERIYDIPKADWRSAAAIVADGAAPGDAIHVLRGSHSFAYYYEPTFDAEQTPIVRDPYSLISGAFDGKRLWLVLWDPTFAEAGRLDLIHRVVGEGHSPVLSEHVHEVGIELWTPGSQTPG